MAVQLDRMGHSVSVIDRSSDSFRRLPSDFNGRKVKGVGFDHDALEQAGIDEAYAFVAVSNGDNSNIVAARVARESFGVDNVVARIYDSRRADVYERLGIPTVATVRQTADQMMRRILPGSSARELEDPSGMVALIQPSASPQWVGTTIGALEDRLGVRVAWISRDATALLPEAAPPEIAAALNALAYHAITTVYLRYPVAPGLPAPITGLGEGTAQWFVDRDALGFGRGEVSAVISLSDQYGKLSREFTKIKVY